MRQLILSAFVLIFYSCQQTASTGTFGESFENKGASNVISALNLYKEGKDSIYVISGTIENVCQGEGCWITIQTEEGEFKIDSKEKFSMPKNSQGKKATAKGHFVTDQDGQIQFAPSGVIIE